MKWRDLFGHSVITPESVYTSPTAKPRWRYDIRKNWWVSKNGSVVAVSCGQIIVYSRFGDDLSVKHG